jgi:Na+-transporting methylmalonyl-CoA/oxaloacetate decarboxylase gamma subunit
MTEKQKLDTEDAFQCQLHDRAREASLEQRKLLISLSTACLGAYFFALTVKVDPVLPYSQKVVLGIGAVFLFVAVLAGLIAWQSDAQRNYFWARGIQATTSEKRSPFLEKKNRWAKRMEASMSVLRYAFALGVFAGVSYSIMRVVAI